MITEKDGQIIVTELRPMSEAGVYPVLVAVRGDDEMRKGHKVSEKTWSVSQCPLLVDECDLLGWLPLPIYQPEPKTCNDCGAANLEDAKKKCLVTEFGEICDGVKFYD